MAIPNCMSQALPQSFHQLEDIKRLRKQSDLNQKELAEKAGVSQSLIAKIESGRVEPSFSKAQKIFHALEEAQQKEEHTAKDIMQKKVATVQAADPLPNVIKLMRTKGISQLPVLRLGNPVGLISEQGILTAIADHPEKLHSLMAENVMNDLPPVLAPDTPQKVILHLLQHYSVVLVAEKGVIIGVIAKTDILRKMG